MFGKRQMADFKMKKRSSILGALTLLLKFMLIGLLLTIEKVIIYLHAMAFSLTMKVQLEGNFCN